MSWAFEGRVSLEIIVNGGIHYSGSRPRRCYAEEYQSFAMLDGSACRFHASCLGIPVLLIITPPFTTLNGSACLFGIGCVGGAGYGARISQGSAVQGYATFLG